VNPLAALGLNFFPVIICNRRPNLDSVNVNTQRAIGVTRSVINGIRSDQVTFIAASLAYYAFISLIPLLLLAFVIASAIYGNEFAQGVATPVKNAVGPQAGQLVENALTSDSGQGGATIFGILLLLWSSLKLFRGLDIAFSTVYNAALPGGLIGQLRNGLITLLAVGAGIAVTVAIGTLLALPGIDIVIGGVSVIGTIGTIAQFGGLTLTLLPLYYVLPGESISVREALPGAVFAAVGWTALQTGFRIYAAQAGNYAAYGAIGGVLLLVTFLYFGGLILLVGVVLNATLVGRIDEKTDLDDPESGSESGTTVTSTTEPSIPRISMPDDENIDIADDLESEFRNLRQQIEEFEERIDDRTVHRDELEGDLKQYIRQRMRRGKARGWGPYLVLLYGTAMTIGAFYFLSGGWAILAMIVVWLSTLGLYVLMLLVGISLNFMGIPGRLKRRVDSFRS
jgi:membrane protein